MLKALAAFALKNVVQVILTFDLCPSIVLEVVSQGTRSCEMSLSDAQWFTSYGVDRDKATRNLAIMLKPVYCIATGDSS